MAAERVYGVRQMSETEIRDLSITRGSCVFLLPLLNRQVFGGKSMLRLVEYGAKWRTHIQGHTVYDLAIRPCEFGAQLTDWCFVDQRFCF